MPRKSKKPGEPFNSPDLAIGYQFTFNGERYGKVIKRKGVDRNMTLAEVHMIAVSMVDGYRKLLEQDAQEKAE